MERFCTYIYAKDTTDRIRTKAMLCHIYHLALHDKWYRARDLMLMSHLQVSARFVNALEMFSLLLLFPSAFFSSCLLFSFPPASLSSCLVIPASLSSCLPAYLSHCFPHFSIAPSPLASRSLSPFLLPSLHRNFLLPFLLTFLLPCTS